MRNLYGTRSIVPNNYSFTFDKIYYEEVPAKQNDGILIGRSVLYHPDKTVYLKTADGYKQIAKLDNTERLIRNEGMVLLPEHNVSSINYLSGDGATYNGDGLYILNYEDLKTESDGETENGSYKNVSTNSVYDANIIYFTKNDQKQYVQTICRNNYKTIEKENDSIYCNYFVTGSDNNYLYPLYVLEDNSFQNISQDNLFYKNGDVKDCGFITSLSGSDNISLKTLMLMRQNDTGGKYYSIKEDSSLSKYEGLAEDKYYFKENDNTYKKINLLSDETVYYTYDDKIFNLISSASPETQIKAKYDLYIYYLLTTNDGDENKKGYFIYEVPSPETEEWKQGTNFPYGLINNNDNYVNNRKKGILYFLSKDDENNIDSWPSIRGIPKEDYLKNSVFLLEQRSNRIIEDETNIVIYENQSDLPNNVPNLYCYTNNDGIITKTLISNTAENWHLAKAAGKKKSIGVPGKLSVEMYQILTDITMYTNTKDEVIEGKQDKDTDRKELYHDNKTFIRKGKRVYKYSGDSIGENNEDTSQVFYKYDPADRHGLIEVPKNSNLSDTSIYIIDKDSSSWGEWEDITEQYTGYIGDLDPNTVGFMSPEESGTQSEYVPAQLPYNKHTQYYIIDNQKKYKSVNIDQVTFDNSFKTKNNDGTISWNKKSSTYYVKANANRGNLNNSNTLVEATNTLDEIIGSKTRLKGTQVNKIKQGSLSQALEEDYRPYNIPENDIMDTLVHHDADIGAIEGLKAGQNKDNNTNNLNFTTVKEPIDENELQVNDIQSIKDALIILDNLIGARRRLDDGTLATNDITLIDSKADYDDERPVYIPENNIIDSIIHHDADIGKIETLSNENDTYNLTFTKQNKQPDNINSSNNETVQVRSLTDAITKLDNMIGYINRLGSKDRALVNSNGHINKKITGTGETDDGRIYDIPETNIIDTIVHHDADIGFIEDFNAISTQDGSTMANNNNITFTNSGNFNNIERNENKKLTTAQVNSLTEAIYTLDKIIGPIAGFNYTTVNAQHNDNGYDVSNDQEDNRTINIPEDNIVYAIGHHDADIGAIEGLKAGQEENNNTHNLNFVKTGKSSNLDNENNKISDINSLTEAIIKLDNMIGYLGRLNANNTDGDYVNTNSGTQGITGTGNNGDARPYSIPETTVIDTLVHHDADIGFIEELNGNNIEFTQTEKDENNKHEIHSLTDAITILDKIIGNYDNIENSDKSNLENYHADLVTAINALDNILGKFKLTENLNASDAKTFIEAIQELDTVLGKFNIEGTKNLKDITTFISAIQKLDILLGTINAETIGSDSVSKQIQSINSSISTINSALDAYQINDIMGYIKNLAENVDVLDVTIHNMMNEQSLMEWGTF